MDAGDVIDLDVTGVAHGGVFVGRHEGRVVFVPDAIPGERVRVRLTDVRKKSFWRGETLEVLDASPHRRPHVWRQADIDVPPEDRPGGADFGHIDLAHQRTLKLDVLTDALRRFGGIEPPTVLIAPAGDGEESENPGGTGWRTRMTLHVDEAGNIGPYAARSHRIVPVEHYPLATPAIERRALARHAGAVGRVDFVQPADGRVRVITRPANQKAAPPEAREVVTERVGEREFQVDAGGFWQVHRLAAATLDAAVRHAVRGALPVTDAEGGILLDPDAWHLDLYGGVGLFAATIAELGGTRVTSVEADERATEHAGENLSEWIGARAETGRVDRWIKALDDRASAAERERLQRGVIVLDPPRAGAGREVVETITRLNPALAVYVACDPVALSRDVATFRERGYELASIAAYDLFPHSHHVETVATFAPPAG